MTIVRERGGWLGVCDHIVRGRRVAGSVTIVRERGRVAGCVTIVRGRRVTRDV